MKCTLIIALVGLSLSDTAAAFHHKLRGSENYSSQVLGSPSRSKKASTSFSQRNLRASFHSSCKLLSNKSVAGALGSFAQKENDLESIQDENCIREVHRVYKSKLKAALKSFEADKAARRRRS